MKVIEKFKIYFHNLKIKILYKKIVDQEIKDKFILNYVFQENKNFQDKFSRLKNIESLNGILFKDSIYTKLLCNSLIKEDREFANFLLNNKKFCFSSYNFDYKLKGKTFLFNSLLGEIPTKHPDVWLALLATHTQWEIVGLSKKTEINEAFAHQFFMHPDFKKLYRDSEVREKILLYAQPIVHPLLSFIFMKIDIDEKAPNNNMQIQKLHKI